MPKINAVLFEEKRKFIIDTARKVFAERGYEGATIKDILNAGGISNGALFVYFQTKRDILLAIIDENLNLFRTRVEAIVDTSDEYSRDEVLLMLLELVRQISLGPGRAMSLHAWAAAMVDPHVKANLDKHFEGILRALTLLLRSMRERGQIASSIHPARTAQALFAVFIPGYILQLLMFPPLEPRAYLNAHRSLWSLD